MIVGLFEIEVMSKDMIKSFNVSLVHKKSPLKYNKRMTHNVI